MAHALKIPEEWRETPYERVSLCLFEYLIKTDKDNLQSLSFLSIARVCNAGVVDEIVVDTVKYFCRDSINYLDVIFILMDDDDAEYELDHGEYVKAKRLGYLSHPSTGEEIIDFDEHIILNFSVSKDFVEVFK